VFAAIFWPSCLLSCPDCTIPTILSGCPVPVVLSQLSCPSYPIPSALSLASCPGRPVLSVLFRLTFPELASQADLSNLTCPSSPVLVVMPQMSCPGCTVTLTRPSFPIPAVLSFLPCSGYPVLSFLSWLYHPDYPLQLSCPVNALCVSAFLSRLLCHSCLVRTVLPQITFTFPTVTSILSCSDRPILSVLYCISRPGYSVPDSLSHITCPGCPVLAVFLGFYTACPVLPGLGCLYIAD
jgi:hypothetical protein